MGGRETERRDIDLMFYLFMHLLVDSCMCPDLGSNLQRCVLDNTLPSGATRPGLIYVFKGSLASALEIVCREVHK